MASTGGVPYLGSKISLVSKADIRYEGILYTIDPNECTVALAKVRSFGTEERPTDRPVSPRDDVFEYIIFRGSDIKDLNVCEPPKAQLTLAHLQVSQFVHDPAIVKQSGPVTSRSQQPPFGSDSSSPLVPSVSAAMSGALGIHSPTQQYVRPKLGEVAPLISKKSPPSLHITIPPKSPVPKSPTKPDAPGTRARRSPGNKRRGPGSGRVIPQSPKEALLAELMGPQAAQPVESAKTGNAAAVASCAAAAEAPPAPASEGSPTKGRRRSRRNGATLRVSAHSVSSANVVPLVAAAAPAAPAHVAAVMAPPTGPPPMVFSSEPREERPQRSPRRIKSTRRRGGRLSTDDSRIASANASTIAPSHVEAPNEAQVPISTSTPSATAPSHGRNATFNTSVSRGTRGRGAGRGNSVPSIGRGGAPSAGRGAAPNLRRGAAPIPGRGAGPRQQSTQKQTFSGPGFQTNYFQGFQAGFNQALQQAYINASVSSLFSPPVQRGGFRGRGMPSRGRGMTRGMTRGAPNYTSRGDYHNAKASSYNTGYAPRHSGNYPPHSGNYPSHPGNYQPYDPCAFVGDYDFEEANSKFDKGKVQEEFHFGHLEATGNPEKDRENAEASKESAAAALKAAVQEAAASLEGPGSPAVAPTAYSPGVYNVNGDFFYDKTKSFYDKISCTSVDKLQHYAQPVTQQAPGGNRVTWREARALNSETFGVPSVAAARRFVQGGVPPSQSPFYRISPSPRGRGRGFFPRGGRGWSPRVRGGWNGRGRGGYVPTSYYAGHINDYHGTDPSTHLTAALAAAAAALPQKAYPTSPLIDINQHLSLPANNAAPTTPLAQSRLVLEPTPSNTPIALPCMKPTDDDAAPKMAATASVIISSVELAAPPHIDSSSEDVVAAAASASGDNLQDSILKEIQEAAALPPPEPAASVAVV